MNVCGDISLSGLIESSLACSLEVRRKNQTVGSRHKVLRIYTTTRLGDWEASGSVGVNPIKIYNKRSTNPLINDIHTKPSCSEKDEEDKVTDRESLGACIYRISICR